MAKVTIKASTPSEEVVQRAALSSVIESAGKSIHLKKPGILAQYRVVDIVGAQSAKNEVYMAMVMPILWVTHIDGEEVPPPLNRMELEALIQRLGEDAVNAVVTHVMDHATAQGSDDAVKK